MNRRAFMAVLLGGAAVAADPERLLWTPGKRLISIPKPRPRYWEGRQIKRTFDPLTGEWSGLWIMETITREELRLRYPDKPLVWA